MNKTISTGAAIAIIMVVVVAFGGIFMWLYGSYQFSNKNVVQFTATPTPDKAAGWETYQDQWQGLAFQYPKTFGANVWRPIFWPPKLTMVPFGQDPVQQGYPNYQSGAVAGVQTKRVGSLDFSLYKSSGAGAGSVYSDYCYVTQKEQYYYILDFFVRYHTGCYEGGCGAYCGTQFESECRHFDVVKDVEEPIGQIVSTFHFTDQIQKTPPPFISEINSGDNGKILIYAVTNRFAVVLDERQYPKENLQCKPAGIIGEISNIPPVEPPFYVVRFEGVSPGICVLRNGDFSVSIQIQ